MNDKQQGQIEHIEPIEFVVGLVCVVGGLGIAMAMIITGASIYAHHVTLWMVCVAIGIYLIQNGIELADTRQLPHGDPDGGR